MTAPAVTRVLKGIEIISRYSDAEEEAVMSDWVWALPPWARPLISSVFCDSQCGALFTITCREGDPRQWCEWYGLLAEVMDTIAIARLGGHNGVIVENGRGEYLYDLEPEWLDEPEAR